MTATLYLSKDAQQPGVRAVREVVKAWRDGPVAPEPNLAQLARKLRPGQVDVQTITGFRRAPERRMLDVSRRGGSDGTGLLQRALREEAAFVARRRSRYREPVWSHKLRFPYAPLEVSNDLITELHGWVTLALAQESYAFWFFTPEQFARHFWELGNLGLLLDLAEASMLGISAQNADLLSISLNLIRFRI